jgi:hypothetical protein
VKNSYQPRSREVTQTMYTHVSKCKNDKVKGENKKKEFLDIAPKIWSMKGQNQEIEFHQKLKLLLYK